MNWMPKSGKEIDARVMKRLQTFFDRLSEAYPDRVVIHFNRDFKKLAERGTELRRLAGYGEDNDAFFTDFGFSYVNALQRQAESHGTYEDLVRRLQEAYPNGIVNLYDAEPFRSDLSYFARKKRRTAKHILRQAGVLRDRKEARAEAAAAEIEETIVVETAPVIESAPVIETTSIATEAPIVEETPVATEAPDPRAALLAEIEEQKQIVAANRGLRGLFGRGAKLRRSAQARIEEIHAELKSLK